MTAPIDWQSKIRAACSLATDKGIRIQRIGSHSGCGGWWLHLPIADSSGKTKLRISGAAAFIQYINAYQPPNQNALSG